MRLLLWLAASLACGLLIARVSIWSQADGLAPLGLSSAIAGAALGAAAAVLARWGRVSKGWPIIAAALVVALATVLAQHWIAYYDFCNVRSTAVERDQRAALFQENDPDFAIPTFADFMKADARDGKAWLWLFEGAVLTGTTLLVLVWFPIREEEPAND